MPRTMRKYEYAAIKDVLLKHAAQYTSGWPQYADHWNLDKWELYTATKDLFTKLGLAATKDQILLGYVMELEGFNGVVLYSVLTGFESWVHHEDVEAVEVLR